MAIPDMNPKLERNFSRKFISGEVHSVDKSAMRNAMNATPSNVRLIFVSLLAELVFLKNRGRRGNANNMTAEHMTKPNKI